MVQVTALIAGSALVAGVLGLWLTGRVRRYALSTGIEDVPNERSSHTRSTPRGGGLSIVALALVGAAFVVWWSPDDWPWCASIFFGGGAIAWVGFRDDRVSLSAGVRLGAQALAAVLLLVLMQGEVTVSLAPSLVLEGPLAWVFTVLYLVWMTNLFNFMDGIDGIAGSQTATTCVGLLVLAPLAPSAPLVAVLAGASLGFLKHNWHPATIFMGDVGSAFLGFTLGVIGLWGQARGVAFPAFLCLMAVFIVDATYTLLRRLVAGERVTQAHRDHAYQHAVQLGRSHATVTLAIIAINLLLLIPAALLAQHVPTYALAAIAIVYAALAIVAWRLGAGRRLPERNTEPAQ